MLLSVPYLMYSQFPIPFSSLAPSHYHDPTKDIFEWRSAISVSLQTICTSRLAPVFDSRTSGTSGDSSFLRLDIMIPFCLPFHRLSYMWRTMELKGTKGGPLVQLGPVSDDSFLQD